MKKNMKFRQKIEGGYPCSKITYVSPFGLSYRLYISDSYVISHDMGWIIYDTNRKREKYGLRKADYTIETLNKLAKTSQEFADEIFFCMDECTVCSDQIVCEEKYTNKTAEKRNHAGAEYISKCFCQILKM